VASSADDEATEVVEISEVSAPQPIEASQSAVDDHRKFKEESQNVSLEDEVLKTLDSLSSQKQWKFHSSQKQSSKYHHLEEEEEEDNAEIVVTDVVDGLNTKEMQNIGLDGSQEESIAHAELGVSGRKPVPMDTVRTNLLRTVVYAYLFAGVGAMMGILGPTGHDIASALGYSDTIIGTISTARASGYLLGSIIGGTVTDFFTRREHFLLTAAHALLIGGLVLTPLCNSIFTVYAASFMLGLGGGTSDVMCNSLMQWTWREGVGPWLQLLHFFFGVGGSITPILVTHVDNATAVDDQTADLRWSYWIFAAFFAVPGLVLPFIRPPMAMSDGAHGHGHGGGHGTGPPQIFTLQIGLLVGLISVMMFVFAGVEVGIITLLPAYIESSHPEKNKKAIDDLANYITAAYWISLTIGRLLISPLTLIVPPMTILFMDVAVSMVFTSLLIGFNSLVFEWVGSAGLGLAMASFMPTALGLPSMLRLHVTAMQVGIMIIVGNIGELVVPLALSGGSKVLGISSFPVIILVCFGLSLGAYVGLFFVARRISKASSFHQHAPGPGLEEYRVSCDSSMGQQILPRGRGTVVLEDDYYSHSFELQERGPSNAERKMEQV